MYSISTKLFFAVFFGAITALPAWASEPVKWTGVIQDEQGYHSVNHDSSHDLEFVQEGDQKALKVVDNKSLLKLHSEKDKNLVVKIEGEVTPQFLFWGGNLKIRTFEVLKELGEIEHREPVKQAKVQREFRGSLRDF